MDLQLLGVDSALGISFYGKVKRYSDCTFYGLNLDILLSLFILDYSICLPGEMLSQQP
jgi:hypothetical protein